MSQQITNRIIMISPDSFGFNTETSATNDWQNVPKDELAARNSALSEFKNMVEILRKEDIEVVVLPSRKDEVTPDAVFPNNWLTTHEDGNKTKAVVYPMFTPNRRAERQVNNLPKALNEIGVKDYEIVDISSDEKTGEILEGTGSLVLDRKNKIAYALESPRTTKVEFENWCQLMDYKGVFFHAIAKSTTGNPIYHTNIAMGIGDKFAVLCSEAITTDEERSIVEEELKKHHELIEISIDQMNKFAGNIIQLKSKNGDSKIFMSQTAYDAFTDSQRETLEKYGKLVVVSIPTIETVGGGSARCMIAELFPSK